MNTEHSSLEQILGHSDVLISQIDEHGAIYYSSPNWIRLFGSPPKRLNICEMCSFTEKHILLQQIVAAKTQNKIQNLRLRLLANDALRWFDLSIAPYNENSTTYFIVTAKDQKHLVQLEESNSSLQSYLSAVQEVSNLGFWQMDINSKELFWSDEVYRIHGVDKNNYTPDITSSLNFYHPDDISRAQQCISEAFHNGKEWTFQLRILWPTGEVRNVISHGNIQFDQTNCPNSIYGTFQDVTEQQDLQNERDLLALAVKNTEVGIIMANEEQKVLWVNHSAEQLTEFTFDELIGQSFLQTLCGKKTDTAAVNQVKEALNSGTPTKIEVLHNKKSGQPYWINLIVTPVYREEQLTHFVAVIHDISEIIFIRDQLTAINRSLESKVQRRTEALEKLNQQLLEQSRVDPLTGALNRRAFFENADSEIKRSKRSLQPISFALIDIDHFKSINDQYGHDAGDSVLKQTVTALKQQLRETDELYRIGGEEFIVIMKDTDEQESKVVAERLRNSVETNQVPVTWLITNVTISIGLFSQCGNISTKTSLIKADAALYKAKNTGRNRVVSHSQFCPN